MVTLRSISKQVLQAIDIFLMLASPLMVLMFIIGVIVLLDRGIQHFHFVKGLQEQGVVTRAEVVNEEPSSPGIAVMFNQPDYGEQYLFIKTDYYAPEVIKSLQEGDQVSILYTPEFNESRAVLADHFEDVKRWLGFAVEPLGMMLLACLAVIVHPEILYLGYVQNLQLFEAGALKKA